MDDTMNRKMNSDEILEAIFDCMQSLFAEKDFARTLKLLNKLGRILVGSDRCSFWFWDKKFKKLWTLDAHGVGKLEIPENTGLVGYSVLNNETLIINDPYNDERFNKDVDKSTGYVTKSILVLPVLSIEGDVIGAYQAINKLEDEGFVEKDIKRLSLAAAFLEKSLDSHISHDAALEDQLTGLKNRKGFSFFYDKKIEPHIKQGGSATMFICDIDHFKMVNDTYGHNAGDAVLKHVASLFKSNAGLNDGLFRWGGEEFIFILPDKSLDECYDFAEHLRTEIEKSTCYFEDLIIKITMSFGINEFVDGVSVTDIIAQADAKLYTAKETGRNKVIR